MKRFLFFLTAIALFLLPHGASAKYVFKHFDKNSGLSHNTVLAVLQDKTGFMWFGTTDGLNRFDGRYFRIYTTNDSQHSIGSNEIRDLYEAQDGKIWVGTDHGLYIYSPETDTFSAFDVQTNKGEKITRAVISIKEHNGNVYLAVDRQGLFSYNTRSKILRNVSIGGHSTITSMTFGAGNRVWLGFFGEGLYYTDDSFRTLHTYSDAKGNEPFHNTSVFAIQPIENGFLYVGTDNRGLVKVNLRNGDIQSVVSKHNGKQVIVRDLLRNNDEIWAATEAGLYVCNIFSGDIQHYQYEPSDLFSLSDNPLQCLYRDREGGVWIGSYFGGVNYSPKEYASFDKHVQRIDKTNSLRGRRVRGLCEDEYGHIWIGTEDHGLNVYDPTTDSYTYIEASKTWTNIHSMCLSGDILWVGTFSYGVHLIDVRTFREVGSYRAGDGSGLPDNSVFSIYRTKEGEMWLGTLGGVCRYNPSDGRFDIEEQVSRTLINDIFEDSRGNIWVAMQGEGVSRRDEKGRWHHYNAAYREAHGLKTGKILSVFEDSKATLWLTTQDRGIYKYSPSTDQFTSVPLPAYNPENFVLQMVEDGNGCLWITTNNGLIRYNTFTEQTTTYTTQNGLLDNQFNASSALFSTTGIMYIGSITGFVSFRPDSFVENHASPNIVATELFINNIETTATTEGTPLEKSITETKEITLRHDQNSFSLRVAALSFNNPGINTIEYKLEGFDNGWNHVFGDNVLTFTNLSSGTYKLFVRVKDNGGEWSKNIYSLKIKISPPPYLTWWAILLYVLLAAVIAFVIYHYWYQHESIKRRMAMEKYQYEKEQELYSSKIKFFTDVAHEIRTPLSLIKSPLENILQQGEHDAETKNDLDIMERNVERLLDLTNQLLDFRKAERDGMKLNFKRCNINSLLSDVYVRFTPLMRNKNLEEHFLLPDETVFATVDKEGVTKIVSNLMTNAIKYCDQYVSVCLTTQAEELVITVENDGKVISHAAHEKIFTPFFRTEDARLSGQTGIGIGLALARSIAELHDGKLTLDDNDKLNVFRLTLPLKQQSAVSFSGTASLSPDEKNADAEPQPYTYPDRDTILVVEDNAEMCQYVMKSLATDYNVLSAGDGSEAQKVLVDNIVTVIVSDVMMQPMDGFELCRSIKNDVRYSHIPIVLLTALTFDSAKIEGMEAGADAYIEKPFSVSYLNSVIKNLIRSRKSIKKAYADSPFTLMKTVSISRADDEFLRKLEDVVTQNMTDSDFDIARLAYEMCMSKTALNRKLRGVLDLTPNNYIKIERLKRAAKLLGEGRNKINEVCYMVGFSSPSYFTQCFQKQFGLLPKDVLEHTGDVVEEE